MPRNVTIASPSTRSSVRFSGSGVVAVIVASTSVWLAMLRSVASAFPSFSVKTVGETNPAVDWKKTGMPIRGCPLSSRTCTVSVVVDEPSAMMLDAPATRSPCPIWIRTSLRNDPR
jgi:hypothetical protein